MALTVVATPKAANANSYITAAEFDSYHEARLHNAKAVSATTAEKEKAVVWATRMLDERFRFKGSPTEPLTQALQWPRDGVYDRLGNLLDEDTIPQILKNVTAELAFHLLLADITRESFEVENRSLQQGRITAKKKPAFASPGIPIWIFQMFPEGWADLKGSGSIKVVR